MKARLIASPRIAQDGVCLDTRLEPHPPDDVNPLASGTCTENQELVSAETTDAVEVDHRNRIRCRPAARLAHVMPRSSSFPLLGAEGHEDDASIGLGPPGE